MGEGAEDVGGRAVNATMRMIAECAKNQGKSRLRRIDYETCTYCCGDTAAGYHICSLCAIRRNLLDMARAERLKRECAQRLSVLQP
jgi:hypothetical protein